MWERFLGIPGLSGFLGILYTRFMRFRFLLLTTFFLAACGGNSQGSVSTSTDAADAKPLTPAVFDISKEFNKPLTSAVGGGEFTRFVEVPTGSVTIGRVRQATKMHRRTKANQLLYVTEGRAQAVVGSTISEVRPGQMIVIPAGFAQKITNIGKENVEFLLFSTPAATEKDVEWLE